MGQDRTTLLDVARAEDPDGTIAEVAEILEEQNPMLQDATAMSSNNRMGNRVTIRSSLPSVEWSRINEGTTLSKGSTKQEVNTIGLLVGMSEVDEKQKLIVGEANFNGHRDLEDRAFMEAFSQEVGQTLISGNELTEENAFTGFQPRLETLGTAITGSQVHAHHDAPTGGDYTSIYFIDWGARGASVIYPKESRAGLMTEDLGKIRVTDRDSKPFMAFVMQYTWLIGLNVADPRRIARLCNIDVSQALADTTKKLTESMTKIFNSMPNQLGFNRVGYMHRDILTALEFQVMRQSNVWFSFDEYLSVKTLHFKGIPLRRHDQITKSESLVT